jgi:diamine N-acetyltransferase
VKEAATARVRLRDIVSSRDRAAVMGLRRGPGQDQYLNSMEEIFAEAGEEQRAMPHPWAVHDTATSALVGFAMISDNVPQPMDYDLVGPYYLWKLLIDHPFQRRGYARRRSTRSWTTSRRGPAPT